MDESTGPLVAGWLREQGHVVFSVYDEARGLDDDTLVTKAVQERMILVTNDKDFGEQVYRLRREHCGVLLLRLRDERAPNKIAVLGRLLTHHSDHLESQFVVVTESRVRFASRLGS